MIALPILVECNLCGKCCERGGVCFARDWDGSGRDVNFVGRCEFLDPPNAKGEQRCRVLDQQDQTSNWFLERVPGTCDAPDIRE